MMRPVKAPSNGFARAASLARRFGEDCSGATAIEYGLIVALIFLAVIGAVNSFTGETNEMYSTINSAMSTP